jgi:transcriptional regulator with XRE-family HTH domain
MSDDDNDIYFGIGEGKDDDSEVVAFNVARLRKGLDMSQTALAEAMQEAGQTHWRQNTVSRVETGKQAFSLGEVRALTDILGGDVMAGTFFSQSLRTSARGLQRAVVARRLKQADDALSQALTDIRELRGHFDDKYREAHRGEHHQED